MVKYASLKDVDKMLEEKLARKDQPIAAQTIEKLRQIALRSKAPKW